MSGKSQSGSHITTIIQNFSLVSLTSSVTTHPAGLPLGVAVPSLPTHLSPYSFVPLRIRLPIHLSPYALVLPLRLCTSWKNIPLRYRSEIVHLSRRHSWLSQYATKKLSCWLDAINAPRFCDSQPCHQTTRVTGWMTRGHLQYIICLMTKAHLQYAIKNSGKLAQWQWSDGYLFLVYHQVSQQWVNSKGVTDIYPSICHWY